jgi:hypothetical protein
MLSCSANFHLTYSPQAAVTGATVAAARAADIAANAMGTIACTPPAERSGTDHYEKVEGKIKAKNLLDRDTHLPQYIWYDMQSIGGSF